MTRRRVTILFSNTSVLGTGRTFISVSQCRVLTSVSSYRFGVVGNCNKKNVKDCYIMPLRATQPVPEALLPMSGQGLPLTRPDLLLSIIVRTKRTRASELPSTSSLMSVPAPPTAPAALQLKVPAEPRSITAGLPPLPLARSVPAPAPAVAPEDDSSPYSPAGSSPEVIEPSSASGGSTFSTQLAKLQREVAAKRAALALREQQHQPQTEQRPPVNTALFSSDLAGHNQNQHQVQHQHQVQPTTPPYLAPPPGGSTLSRMSSEDLLAAAAAMEQHSSPTKQSLPPPGPGMPGNLIGQGMANIELAREEKGYGGYGGGWDSRGGFRGGFYRGRGGGGGGGGQGPGWMDRRGRGGGGWGDRRGRGGWDRGRDHGDHGDWDRRDERRDRRDERDRGGRGGWRERERWGGDYRRDRRDYDRRDYRDRDRDRERERERNRPRHDNRRYEEGERSRPSLGTEDWSDEEIRVESDSSSQNTSSVHLDVQEEIANFDKQFLPKSGE